MPSASRSARTSGTRGRPPPPRLRPAPSSWSTRPPPRTTAARAPGASAWSPSALARRAAPSPSATPSEARTSWSSTGTASSSTPPATRLRAGPSSATRSSSATWSSAPEPRRETGPARAPRRLRGAAGAGRAGCRGRSARVHARPAPREVYEALTLGLRDYVDKNGFARVLVAVSGGIDSALVAMLAADALGGDRLTCVVMPSPHSSEETQADARTIAGNLGRSCWRCRSRARWTSTTSLLAEDGDRGPGRGRPMAENLQARIRGNLMMALSNRSGWLVLTTGNKSEMSVGYATLYGDMAGGFAVIKDVPKTLVYALVRDRNEREGTRARPGVGARARSVGGAPARPARRRLAAALRGARPDPRALRRGRPGPRRDRGRGARCRRSSTRS